MARTSQSGQRDKIISAARQRILHYGYRKTTIDEIAVDAGIGKGTVYLYFEGKEDIAIAVMQQMKSESLASLEVIAAEPCADNLAKLKRVLAYTPIIANQRCTECPAASELIVALKPVFMQYMLPFYEREIALISDVLHLGVQSGEFRPVHEEQTAKVLKSMVSGFLPPYSPTTDKRAIETSVGAIVDLVFNGIKPEPNTNALPAFRENGSTAGTNK